MYGVSNCSAARLAAAPSANPEFAVVGTGSVVVVPSTSDVGAADAGIASDVDTADAGDVGDPPLIATKPPASRHNEAAVAAVTLREARLIVRTVAFNHPKSAMMGSMCGRFVSASSADSIAEYFGATFSGESLGENYNVAPTNDIYGVVADPDGSLRLEVFHWGLIPSWAKERKIGAKMINARAETLAEKPAYKSVFRKHRCIIPMDGFYEWQAGTADGPVTAKGKPAKQPMFVQSQNGDHRHDLSERDDEPGARSHACDPAAVALGRVAQPRHARHRPPLATVGAGRR